MKKNIKRVLCFLLAFVVMLSLPLDTQAKAVATESWMIYALITYLAGMGITFTVAGGVDAMIQAIEEKVNDYEQANNIIDFYDYLRNRNVRFVPNNNQDPEGNNFFDLFFTASAVEAIQAFANWLTQNGWGLDNSYNYSDSTFISSGFVDGQEQTLIYTKAKGEILHQQNYGTYYMYHLDTYNLDFVYPLSATGINEQIFNKNNLYIVRTNGFEQYQTITDVNSDSLNLLTYSSSTATGGLLYFNRASNPYSLENIVGVTVAKMETSNNLYFALVYDDGTIYTLGKFYAPSDFVQLSSSVDIMTPEEFREQFPSVNQGVSIKDAIEFPFGDPSLEEWANRIEEQFIETGTIPNPQPEIIQDPDLAPDPTPVPTPVPSPEIEDIGDLGLPALGEAIFNKFPFSLPKDLKRIASLLNAEPVTPKWEIDLYETLGDRVPFAGDTTISIDLEEYEVLGQISRWASVITFVIFLIIITKGVIRW